MDVDATSAAVVRDNWHRVSAQVADACQRADRDPSEVTIVGVTKYVGPELAVQLLQAGCRDLGENRPQHFWELYEYCARANAEAAVDVRWHMIGHLQRNKVRRTLPMISCLHSLDSLRLAATLQEEASKCNRELHVLLEVNVTGDPHKTGLPPAQLPQLLDELLPLSKLRVSGLMAMSSLNASPEEARRQFESVRQLRDALQKSFAGQIQLRELSMGMSGDFGAAIVAGATLVRIGTSLWEGLL